MLRYTLTPQQKRLWIEWKLNPTGHYYNINAQFRLVGSLDIKRFTHALTAATGFFEAFRTYFEEENGVPKQAIVPRVHDILEIIELTTEQDAKEILNKRAKEPIDLKQYPLMRAVLIKVTPEIHYFMLITPHILSDGQSGKIIFEAISAVYNREEALISKFERHAHASIADFIQFQNQQETKDADYWENYLSDAPLHINIGESGSSKNRDGRRHYFEFPPSVYQRLKGLAKREHTTPFNLLAAAYAVFLSRHCNVDDIVFTYPVNIRAPEFNHAFGFYINTIPLRVKISKSASFQSLIQQITEQRRLDRDHENSSTDEIIRHLRKQRVAVAEAPFNVSFGQTSFSLQYLRLQHLHVEPLRCDPAETHSDFSLQYDGTSNTLGFYWEYKTELFDVARIEYLTESFLTLLTNAVEQPQTPVNSLSILSESQYTQLQYKVGTFADNHEDRYDYPLVAAIAEYALKTPRAIALKAPYVELTYAQLEEKTNRLAHYLRQQGVRRHDFVAICMERSEALVVALIAILKAGAAYVPIDPAYPVERIGEIIADCCPRLVLCNQMTQTSLSAAISSVSSLCLDDAHTTESIKKCPTSSPRIAFDKDDIAYIIYTSGSSGTPKGVLVSHANVNARLGCLQNEISLSAADCALQTINYCFDPSVFEIFWPLRAGATLVLPKPGITLDPRALIKIIDDEKITFFSTIPSLLRLFLQKLEIGQCQTLRYALCGGEVLPRALANDFVKRTSARLYNAYGPTEATILASFHECGVEDNACSLPIGKPLDDTAIYVLNEDRQLQPMGVVGELYIGGAGIAKGYLNRPELTAEKFVDDCFSAGGGSKLYRTGDLGRYLSNGSLEFIGRADSQLKIRGFRIEPGEIEHALTQLPDIAQAVVIAQVIASGNRLVAYYSPATVTSDEARRYLERQLPAHMVPALLMPLDVMPITNNGKIDRHRLPEPQHLQLTTQTEQTLNNIQQRLQNAFGEILEMDPGLIGLDDKFFDIGGDSLQTIELALLINQTLKQELSDTIIFAYPSIRTLAAHLEALGAPHSNTNLTIQHRVANRQRAQDIRRKLHRVG